MWASQTMPRMRSYPDTGSQEMVLLGSAYPKIKAVSPKFDGVMECLRKGLEDELASVSPESLQELMVRAPELLFSREELPDGMPEEMAEFVCSCRRIINKRLAYCYVEQLWESTIRAGRMIGDVEYSVRMQMKDIDPELWQSAALRKPGEVVLDG